MIRSTTRSRLGAVLVAGAAALCLLLAVPVAGDDSDTLLTIDHQVRVRSTVPAIAGQAAHIYVRERVKAGTALRGATGGERVVLFVHGAGTPAEVAFDVPYEDYSWMAYLAREGYDVFSMDFTGYGRSTRPPAMNDPCNLASEQQATLVPHLLSHPCPPPIRTS
jgi:pimeloyl-ACP methyl ester carboxylesterase